MHTDPKDKTGSEPVDPDEPVELSPESLDLIVAAGGSIPVN